MTAPETSLLAPSFTERPRLIIHIGDPKTGSTSIQQALYGKTWSAAGHSIAYPDILNALPLARALLPGSPPKLRKDQFGKMAQWLSRQSAEIAVISSEHFAPIPPTKLKAAIKTFFPDYIDDLRIIAYVRPHIPRLLSSYTQRVKARGLKQDFETFCQSTLDDRRFHYTSRFLSWQAEFGEAFTLRPMLRDALYRGDVVADFLYQAIGSDNFTLNDTVEANVAPTLDHLACLRVVHNAIKQAGLDDDIRFACGKYLADSLVRSNPDGPRQKLPLPLLPMLQQAYAEDAATLDATFFDGTPMSDALAAAGKNATDRPQSLDPDQRFSPDQLRKLEDISARLATALARTPKRWKRYFREAPTMSTDSGRITAPEGHEILDEICTLLS